MDCLNNRQSIVGTRKLNDTQKTMRNNKQEYTNPSYSIALWTLVLLFCLRVTGQFLQFFSSLSWLPQADEWQGSSLPYWLLLLIQMSIIAIMVRTTLRYTSNDITRHPKKGKWLLAIGGVYFVSMATRLIIGLANLSAAPWFHKPLPAFFHLVLAAFVLLIGAFHMNWVGRKKPLSL